MKKLLSVFITLLFPVALLGQMNNASFNLYQAESFGFGVGGIYAPDDIGGGMFIASDFKGKHNSSDLETGVGADVAIGLRQTDQVESWISVTGVFAIKMTNTFWFLGGGGVAFFDTFTEHENRYWVYRDRVSATNLLAGTMISIDDNILVNATFNTEPMGVGIGLGIKINPNNGN